MAINPKVKQKAEDIRKKIFGSEVRESLASGLEGMSEDVESIKGRQGNVEQQFQDVLDETTDKDFNSAPEIKAARNGKSNLKTRLDDEHAQVTAQLQQTEQELSAKLAETVTQRQESVNLGTTKNTYSLKPLVTFVDDDGKSEVYTKLLPIFTEKGVPFVSCVTSSKIGTTGHMSLSQILEIQAQGNEIASHGVNHYGVTSYIDDIGESYESLNDMGLKVDNLVWVGGDFNLETIKEAKKYYNCAVKVGGGVNFSPVRQFALSRFYIATPLANPDNPQVFNGIPENNTLASYKAIVDYAFANNAWLIFGTHCWYPEFDAIQEGYLREIIDYIKTKNMPIVTLNDGLKKYGNKIDVGDTSFVSEGNFIVGANGDIISTGLDKKLSNLALSVPKITTEVHKVAAQSLAIAGSLTVVVPLANMAAYSLTQSSVVAMPYGGIEANVLWNVQVTTAKEVRLTLYNISTTNTRGTAARNWAFKIIY